MGRCFSFPFFIYYQFPWRPRDCCCRFSSRSQSDILRSEEILGPLPPILFFHGLPVVMSSQRTLCGKPNKHRHCWRKSQGQWQNRWKPGQNENASSLPKTQDSVLFKVLKYNVLPFHSLSTFLPLLKLSNLKFNINRMNHYSLLHHSISKFQF